MASIDGRGEAPPLVKERWRGDIKLPRPNILWLGEQRMEKGIRWEMAAKGVVDTDPGRARPMDSPELRNLIEWIVHAIGVPQAPEPDRLARLGRAVEEISRRPTARGAAKRASSDGGARAKRSASVRH